MSNDQMLEEEKKVIEQENQARQSQQHIIDLSAHIRKCWRAAFDAKRPIEQAMIKSLFQRNGFYTAEKLSALKQFNSSTIFMMLTDEKCCSAEAQIEDILLPANDLPFGVTHTPYVDLSPEQTEAIKQTVQLEAMQDIQLGLAVTPMQMIERAKGLVVEVQARMNEISKDAAEKVDLYVKDKIVESNWKNEFKKFIADFVTFKCGFIEGPIIRNEKEIVWGANNEPAVKLMIKIKFQCWSPFDVYPMPSCSDIDDGGLFLKCSYTRGDIYKLIGQEGFDSAAIKTALMQYGQSGLQDWMWLGQEQQRRHLEGKDDAWKDPEAKIDVLRYFGNVQGLMLLQYGMPPQMIDDPFSEYPVEVWTIGNYVIKCVLNFDPLGRKPIFKSSFRKRNGSFWGDGLPETIADIQDMCNAAARAIANNMGIASGPQVGVDMSVMPPGARVGEIFPWRIWPFDMKGSSTSRPPIWFFQPNDMTEKLLKVYEFFSFEADNKTGFPRYAYGGQQSGSQAALGTATGFSMMMNNVSKNVKKVIGNIDIDVTEQQIRRVHEWLMIYDRNPILFLGDSKIVAMGSSKLVVKEQMQMRRQEFLQIALNPAVLQLIGLPGLSEILRHVMQGIDFNVDKIIPTPEMLKRMEAMMQMQAADASQGGGSGGGGEKGKPKGAVAPKKAEAVNPAGDRVQGQDFRQVGNGERN
jgi:hypothetical protein